MKKVLLGAKKVVIALIAFPLLIFGIILIPLPGPGLVVCALALFLLSLEFDWANRYFDKAKQELVAIYNKAKERADKIEQLADKKDPKQD